MKNEEISFCEIEKNRLDQMAKNLIKCSQRSLNEVLDSLGEHQRDYLLKTMSSLNKK